MVAVSQKLVKSDPALVQKYVCAEVQATRDFTGPDADQYLTAERQAPGVPGNLIVSATKAYPFIPLNQQLHWLGAPPTMPKPDRQRLRADGYSSWSGRAASPRLRPRRLATHVDSSFVKKALAGGCSG